MKKDRCEQCAQPTASYDAIHYGSVEGGYRLLCTQCFNAEVAKRSGVTDFENVRLEPIRMIDCSGAAHQFHFQMRLLATMLVLDAFEIQDGFRAGVMNSGSSANRKMTCWPCLAASLKK
ncbi:hypothetical protein [Paraburkholderia sp. BL23I1N1]|uniref:DUF7685 domain-containing protein n=1 Tax=Paraburkholderia sp. BL23I1N1 TaxID=1938802 RepID=UPI00217DA1A3|nr:hypothetical protein [Paraburkholderia sp. BL23I1N1]